MVTKRPAQPANAMGLRLDVVARRDGAEDDALEGEVEQALPLLVPCSLRGTTFECSEAHDEHGDGDAEAGEGAGGADVEEGVARPDAPAHGR